MCPTWTQGVRGESLPSGREKRTEAAIGAPVRFCVYGEEIRKNAKIVALLCLDKY